MTQKELKYQIALGSINLGQLRAVNILAIKDYKLYCRLYSMFRKSMPIPNSVNTHFTLSRAFYQHHFYKHYKIDYTHGILNGTLNIEFG